ICCDVVPTQTVVVRMAPNIAPARNDAVAEIPKRSYERVCVSERATKAPIGVWSVAEQLDFSWRRQQALVENQPEKNTGGTAAPAETKQEYLIARLVCLTEIDVRVYDVALQAPAEGSSDNGENTQRRCADAVLIVGDLLENPAAFLVFCNL